MDMQNKRERTLSVVTAATLAASLGVPAMSAFADDGLDTGRFDVVASEGQKGGLEGDAANAPEALPAAIVTSADGTIQTPYDNAKVAAKEMKAGETLTLNEDYAGEWGLKVTAPNTVIDLNGHSVTSTKSNGYGIKFEVKASENYKVTVRNSSDVQSKIMCNNKQIDAVGKGDAVMNVDLQVGDIAFLNLDGSESSVGSSTNQQARFIYTDEACKAMSNGGFVVNEADGGSYIRSSCAHALANSVDGVAKLIHNYTGNEHIISGSKGGVIDLQGWSYAYTGTRQIVDVNYGNVSLTIKNGTLNSSADALEQGGATVLYSDSSLTLEDVALNVPGDSYGIVTNGTNKNNSITLRNSMLNVPEGQGIYFPSSGSVVVENSDIIAKHNGVQMCSGSLVVSGRGTHIKVTGDPLPKTENDGGIADGAAISIVDRGYPGGVPVALIKDGTFESGPKSNSIKAYSFDGASKTEKDWAADSKPASVEGGSFNNAPDYMDGLLADGADSKVNEDGSISVVVPEAERVAEIDGVYYGSLQAAIDNAAPGHTVTLVSSADESIVVSAGKYLTIELNGNNIVSQTGPAITNEGILCVADETGLGVVKAADGSPSVVNTGEVDLRGGSYSSNPSAFLAEGYEAVKSGDVWKVVKKQQVVVPPAPSYPSYDVALPAFDGGAIAATPAKAKAGDTVKLVVKPDAGKKLASIAVLDSEGRAVELTEAADGSYTFEMPAGGVSIEAAFACDGGALCPLHAFSDFDPDAWYHEALDWAVADGIVRGIEGTDLVIPHGVTTRAQVVTMLARMADVDTKTPSEASFVDVPADMWCAGAVAWAVDEGIVAGYGDGAFGPDDPVTREQMALLLHRFAAAQGCDVSERADLSAFPDAEAVNTWAADAMSWVVAKGYVRGVSDAVLQPQGTAERAQTATMLKRFNDDNGPRG